MESLQKQMYVYKFPHIYWVGGQRLLDCEENKERRMSSTQSALQFQDQQSPLLEVKCLLRLQDEVGGTYPGQVALSAIMPKNVHFART